MINHADKIFVILNHKDQTFGNFLKNLVAVREKKKLPMDYVIKRILNDELVDDVVRLLQPWTQNKWSRRLDIRLQSFYAISDSCVEI
jgi:hypothetical protein